MNKKSNPRKKNDAIHFFLFLLILCAFAYYKSNEGQKVDVANSSLQEESAKAFHNTNSIQPRIFNLK